MSLLKQLAKNKRSILKKWFNGIIASYPADTAQFLAGQKDPFANPVGQTTQQNLAAIIDHILDDADPQSIRDLMDPIIRIRAIQDFTPANAVRWIFDLKDVIRKDINPQANDGTLLLELGRLERQIDELGLLAFDIYLKCREKIYDLKANEMKARTYSAFARAGLIKEPDDDESPLK